MEKTRIKYNKINGILLFFNKTQQVELDSLSNPKKIRTSNEYGNHEQEIISATSYEIILIKYIFPVVLILLLQNYNQHYTSTLGLAMSAMIYLIILSVSRITQNTILLKTIGILPIGVLIYLIASDYGLIKEYHIVEIFNYVYFQYILYLYIIHQIYVDIVNQKFLLYTLRDIYF